MIENDTPQQLTLLPSSEVPVQFRLDAETRRRGMQHVAEIRRQLEARRVAKARVEHLPARAPLRSRAA